MVVSHLLETADLLRRDDGLQLAVAALPWLNHVDPDWLGGLAAEFDQIVVVEHQYTRGGQADLVARALLELRLERRPAFHGVGLTAVPACGSPDEVLGHHRLAPADLAARIRERVLTPARPTRKA
jgi:transketolase